MMALTTVDAFPVNWVDFLVMLALIVGIVRGRRRGMSEELLDVVKWVLVVFLGAYIYEPVGKLLAYYTYFADLYCYIMVYMAVVAVFVLVASYLRPRMKVVGSDFFGNGEYYLGMVAGAFRYLCIILVLLALLNARYYSPDEIRQENAYQENYFGSIRFPTMSALQTAVMQNSLTGSMARNYLSPLLIRSTVPDEKQLGRAGIMNSRDRMMDDIVGKK